MKNTNKNEFKENLKAYLTPIIKEKAESYHVMFADPYAWCVMIAKEEVPHEFVRKGEQEGLKYWLEGLALNIAYTYSDIIDEAENMHECKLTEKQADKVCENWFNFMACKILQFSRA